MAGDLRSSVLQKFAPARLRASRGRLGVLVSLRSGWGWLRGGEAKNQTAGERKCSRGPSAF